jgi:hypothetical protein
MSQSSLPNCLQGHEDLTCLTTARSEAVGDIVGFTGCISKGMMLMQGSSETEREVSIKDFPFTSDGIVAVWCFCVPDGTAPDVSPRLPTEPVDIQNTRHTNVEANPWSLFLGR